MKVQYNELSILDILTNHKSNSLDHIEGIHSSSTHNFPVFYGNLFVHGENMRRTADIKHLVSSNFRNIES